MDLTAHGMYGAAPQAPAYGPAAAAPTQAMGRARDDIASGWRGLVDPSNPLVWFGALLLVTVGAAAVAGSVKLGPAKLKMGVG